VAAYWSQAVAISRALPALTIILLEYGWDITATPPPDRPRRRTSRVSTRPPTLTICSAAVSIWSGSSPAL
jgi:hypothetical protein